METVKLSLIAKALGVSGPRVTQLKAKGMPVDSIDAALAWYRVQINQKMSPKIFGSKAIPPAAESKAAVDAVCYDLNVSRAKREHHEANIADMKERQMAGSLVEADRVTRIVTEWAALARSAMERIPDKLADRVASLSDTVECHELMTAEIDQVLVELASSARLLRLDGN